MTRRELKQLAATIASQVRDKPFDYWTVQDYPVTWEQTQDGALVQVEVDRLESANGFSHLTIALDDGRCPSAFIPVSIDVILQGRKS
jgi:hypothetical protein